jgi:alkanesulfonate monooxygenase SsuD/methylene tetrahydromethanopterin reductase-like flavin-dependent oxidoreductase (luciferase family)
MSAGISAAGRDFAARAADILFTSLPDLAEAPQLIRNVQQEAERHNRTTEVYTQTQIVCRATRREAEEFYYYFAEEQADEEALDYFRRQKLIATEKNSKEAAHYQRQRADRFTEGTGKRYAGLFPGMHPIVGTPDEVVGQLERLKAAGISGSALVFLNYLSEMPFFIQEVLPRMERVGLRNPLASAT